MQHKKQWGLLLAIALLFVATCAYAADALTITTLRCPNGDIYKEYSTQLTATGGTPFEGGGYHWQLMSGSLPDGLTLSEDGVISGTPTEPGSFGGLNFMVTDADGNTTRRYIGLAIKAETAHFTITSNNHQYDGKPHTVHVTVRESAITADDFTVTYDGAESQTAVGTYIVTITANESMKRKGYKVGSYSPRMLSIVPNESNSITLAGATFPYDGTQHALTPVVSPEGLPYKVTYTGRGTTEYGPTETPPADAGVYTVVAETTDPNYETKRATAVLTITAPKVDFTVTQYEYTYDGSGHTAQFTPSDSAATDYTVTYDNAATAEVETLAECVEAGVYNINISFPKGSNREVGNVSQRQLTVNKRTVNFTVTDNEVSYTGSAQTATVTPDVTGLTAGVDYTVGYRLGGSSDEPQAAATAAGEYDIVVTFPEGSSNQLGTVLPGKFIIGKQTVDFTVTDNEYTYDKTGHTATLTPSVGGFADYTVTYDNAATDVVETLAACENAGTYNINVSLPEGSSYAVGEVEPGQLTVSPAAVSFTLDQIESYYTAGETVTTTATPDVAGFTAYTITYDDTATAEVEEAAAMSAPGVYNVIVKLADANYTVANANIGTYTLHEKIKVNFTVSPAASAYTGSEQTVTVTPGTELPEGETYTVTYTKAGTEETVEAPLEVGVYDVGVSFAADSIYQVGTIDPAQFEVTKAVLNFTAADLTYTYDQDGHTATVTPEGSLPEGVTYTVTYDNAATDEAEELAECVNAGTYNININLPEGSPYTVQLTGDAQLVIDPAEVSFTLDENEGYYPAGAVVTAPVTPGVAGFTAYTVTYDDTATTELETLAAMSAAGTYNVIVTVTDSNYTTANANIGTYTLAAKGLLTLGLGNSIAARLADDPDALAEFCANHIYAGVAYPAAAWGEDANLDEDAAACFIFSLNLPELAYTAVYSDGTAVPAEEVSITIDGKDTAAWLAADPAPQLGVYDMVYSFTDKAGDSPITQTRKLVYLPQQKFGDLNGDRNLNMGDARYLQAQILANPDMASLGGLYLYRVCDLNHDGRVDEEDAAAIINRMQTPLTPYYAELQAE